MDDSFFAPNYHAGRRVVSYVIFWNYTAAADVGLYEYVNL